MITHHRIIAATVAGAAALTLGLSAAGGAQATGHHHRLTVISHELSSTPTGKKLVESDQLTRSGTTIGYTANTCTFDFTTHTALCLVSVALNNGQLRARATVNADTGVVKGHIVGGSGAYRGARGTVAGHPGGSHPGDERIVLDWTD